jgi:hypothetical protein
VGANVSHGAQERISFPQVFQSRMRVAFLPEEITTTSSNLSGGSPELGLKRVTAPLTWEDG